MPDRTLSNGSFDAMDAMDTPLALAVSVRRRGESVPFALHVFDGPFLIVGRRSDCDLCLNHPTVSARHLYLQKLPGRVVAMDLGSSDYGKRTGVLGEPNRMTADVLLPGEEVQVGEFLLAYSTDDSSWCWANRDDDPLPPLGQPVASWSRTDSAAGPARWLLRREITLIGRGPHCRIRLAHDSVSTTHASLVCKDGGVHVIDLCSRHGVRVNGNLVKSAQLQDGDELSIGECRGVVRLLTASPAVRQDQDVSAASDVDGLADDDGLVVRLDADLAPPSSVSPRDYDAEVRALIEKFAEQHRHLREQTEQLVAFVSRRLEMAKGSVRRSTRFPSASGRAAPPPELISNTEFHAWLNRQLVGLEEGERAGLTQFWKSLIGRS
jgi:pSer/pThr/pTyr-binding forkhead associated (FHA) protein